MPVGGWESFFVAEVGASAALAGLVFVGVSISLEKILAHRSLPGRALESLVVLLIVLVLSSLMLVPEQSLTTVGLEILGVGVVGWVVVTALHVRRWRLVEPEFRSKSTPTILVGQVAVIPLVIAGIAVLAWGADGLYWLVPGVILCFLDAMLNAWVLLVEIHR
jgi:modulator of FtsH protease